LEEKIDFLYENYEDEKKGIGHDKLLIKNIKSVIQLHSSCVNLVKNIQNKTPDKKILEEKIEMFSQFIYE